MDIIAQGIGKPAGIMPFLLVGLLIPAPAGTKLDVGMTDTPAENLALSDTAAAGLATADAQTYTVTLSDATRA
jgi:hypothetical protein